MGQKHIRRIVVRSTTWVGDAVMSVPALRELRRLFPEAHLTLATRNWAKGIFADVEFIDDLLIYERRGLISVFDQVREWRSRNFDLAVVFPNSFESALIPAAARVPNRIGYATNKRRRLLTSPLTAPEWRSNKHEIFYYLNIVSELERLIGGKQTVLAREPDCSITVSQERRAAALNQLSVAGAALDRPLVVLCPGSINSRAKRWPADRFALLGDLCIEELGAEVVLLGSLGELNVSEEVSAGMRNKPVMLTGKTDLTQAVAILSVANLLVTNDTGPAHIASALGQPTLVIFGPTNHLTTRPFGPTAEVLRRPPDCAPCMLRDCPIDHRCMTAITPDEVFEHARLLMGKFSVERSGEVGTRWAAVSKP